ncbi:MAG: hypothetical protein ORN83_00650, partial [Chthoniobacteraceae bacterium]|nr:hypothetical protein [Chthoniobacteraceae bacterium]
MHTEFGATTKKAGEETTLLGGSKNKFWYRKPDFTINPFRIYVCTNPLSATVSQTVSQTVS